MPTPYATIISTAAAMAGLGKRTIFAQSYLSAQVGSSNYWLIDVDTWHWDGPPFLSFDTWRRFWDKVEIQSPAGCWVWTGAKSRAGTTTKVWQNFYGNFRIGQTFYKAHRLAWSVFRGPLAGRQETLDHLTGTLDGVVGRCTTTLCINPDHMEVCSPEENSRRKWARYNQAAAIAAISTSQALDLGQG